MRRHIDTSLRLNRILRPPQTSHSLLLRIKRQPRLSVERIRSSACNTLLIAREAEHWQWYGDRYVNSNLASLEVFLESGGGGTGASEYGGAVAVFVVVDESDGIVGGFDV